MSMKQAAIILTFSRGNVRTCKEYRVKQLKNTVDWDIGQFLDRDEVNAIIDSNCYEVTIVAHKG